MRDHAKIHRLDILLGKIVIEERTVPARPDFRRQPSNLRLRNGPTLLPLANREPATPDSDSQQTETGLDFKSIFQMADAIEEIEVPQASKTE